MSLLLAIVDVDVDVEYLFLLNERDVEQTTECATLQEQLME